MAKPKVGLGRGLSALIPTRMSGVEEVDIDLLTPNPRQPRTILDPTALEGLAQSIREHGILQPLLVTEVRSAENQRVEGYQVIAGERRLQAAKMVGLGQVPVVVKEASPGETLELALVENLQRTDLNPLEEARAYRQLMDEFGMTQERVAARVGKNRSTVANSIRLLNLCQEVKDSLAAGEITEGHARSLLALENEEVQRFFLGRLRRLGWNVRQTEEAVRRWLRPGRRRSLFSPDSADTRELEERFRSALGTRVNLFRGRKGGRLIIYFYSDEELEALYQRLAE